MSSTLKVHDAMRQSVQTESQSSSRTSFIWRSLVLMNAGNNVVGIDRVLVGVDDASSCIKFSPRVALYFFIAGIFVV
eukprot:CCRYP_017112-RA/>CCRYP_017112-RA protein AED:0.43 eAED:0.59 QI:257/0/0.5/1/0/0/2/0/76